MRKFSWCSAAVLSMVLGDASLSQAQALTGAADAFAENASDANLERMRSAAYSAYTRQEYALQPDGNLRGRVRAVDSSGTLTPARVKLFFVRHGEIISQASPNGEGEFQANGLAPGYYSVISYGQGGFSSSGIKVVAPPEKSEPPKANTIGRTREIALTKESAVVGADSLHITLIKPSDVSAAFGLSQMMNGPTMAAAIAPNSAQGMNIAVVAETKKADAADPNLAADDLAPEYADEMIVGAYERNAYWLGADGKLSARLMKFNDAAELVPSPNMPIFFLRDGRVIAQARSGADATYSVILAPGYYSFVVAGQQTLGAQGIMIMPAPAVEQVPATKAKSVSFRLNASQPGGPPGPNAGGSPSGDANAGTGGASGGGGGFGAGGAGAGGAGGTGAAGGGGAAGGAGGLGGGLGGLVAAGGMVAGAAAIGQNNNNSGTTTSNSTNN